MTRYEVVYTFGRIGSGLPAWYVSGSYRWKFLARMQAWVISDLGWDVKIIDRKTGKVLDAPGFNR